MSKLQAFRWSLAVAVLLLPAALHAQAKTDSSSAYHRHATTTGVPGGLLEAIAADTGQVPQPASTSIPDRQGQTPKTLRREAAADSVKKRDDAIRGESFSPY